MPTRIGEEEEAKAFSIIQEHLRTPEGRQMILRSLEKPLRLRKDHKGTVTLWPKMETYALFSALAIMSTKKEKIPEEWKPHIEEAMRNFFAAPSRYKPYEGERPTVWEHLDDSV